MQLIILLATLLCLFWSIIARIVSAVIVCFLVFLGLCLYEHGYIDFTHYSRLNFLTERF
jgi:hypothetical protein